MPTSSRPNILWISFEDTSPRFGCYGDPVARTPNVDRLAAEGRLYTRAFSVAGVCSPSRSAIITGLYPPSVGTHHHRTAHTNPFTPEMPTPYGAVLPHYAKMLPEYFRAAGYYCTNNVKADYQFKPPFTAWDDWSKTAHWRNRTDQSQPFFSVFNFEASHESGMWEENGAPRTDPNSLSLPPWIPDTRKCREALARQYDHIADNDTLLGELLTALDEDGLSDNTIVFLWSDHGEGIPRAKRWLYDAGTRIPLIVRWPGRLEPGIINDELVSLIDLGPTILSLSGLEVPCHMQGSPFLGPDAEKRDYVFGCRDRLDEAYDMVRSVRDKRFKYIRNYCPEMSRLPWVPYQNRHPIMQEMWRLHAEGSLEGPQTLLFETSRQAEELYDLDLDPHELQNLARNPESRPHLVRLRAALDDWRDEIGDLGDIDEREMKERWWQGPNQPVTAKPIFVPITTSSPGMEPVDGNITLTGPVLLQLHCATQGASIGWTTGQEAEPSWHLYTGPIRLKTGTTTLRVKAIRIGYLPSEERAASFHVI